MTTKNNKRIFLQVQVTEELKEEFFKICEENSINPSAWMRKQVEEFISKHKNQ